MRRSLFVLGVGMLACGLALAWWLWMCSRGDREMFAVHWYSVGNIPVALWRVGAFAVVPLLTFGTIMTVACRRPHHGTPPPPSN